MSMFYFTTINFTTLHYSVPHWTHCSISLHYTQEYFIILRHTASSKLQCILENLNILSTALQYTAIQCIKLNTPHPLHHTPFNCTQCTPLHHPIEQKTLSKCGRIGPDSPNDGFVVLSVQPSKSIRGKCTTHCVLFIVHYALHSLYCTTIPRFMFAVHWFSAFSPLNSPQQCR